jgi:hypothetical protein
MPARHITSGYATVMLLTESAQLSNCMPGPFQRKAIALHECDAVAGERVASPLTRSDGSWVWNEVWCPLVYLCWYDALAALLHALHIQLE